MLWIAKNICRCLMILSSWGVLSGCVTADFFGPETVTLVPAGSCVQLTPENALHPVGSCEKSDTYEFLVEDKTYVYNKREFRQKLRQQLIYALQRTAFPLAELNKLQIDVWTLAPIFSPSATQLIVVARGSSAPNFSIHIPIDMNKWQIRDENFVLLGSENYPSRAARKAGQILIEVTPYGHTQHQLLTQWFTDAGISGPVPQTSVKTLKSMAFGEAALAKALTAHPYAKRLLRQVHYVPAGHLEGTKALSFSFPLFERALAEAKRERL